MAFCAEANSLKWLNIFHPLPWYIAANTHLCLRIFTFSKDQHSRHHMEILNSQWPALLKWLTFGLCPRRGGRGIHEENVSFYSVHFLSLIEWKVGTIPGFSWQYQEIDLWAPLTIGLKDLPQLLLTDCLFSLPLICFLCFQIVHCFKAERRSTMKSKSCHNSSLFSLMDVSFIFCK